MHDFWENMHDFWEICMISGKICMISGKICMISGKICMISGKICMISGKICTDGSSGGSEIPGLGRSTPFKSNIVRTPLAKAVWGIKQIIT